MYVLVIDVSSNSQISDMYDGRAEINICCLISVANHMDRSKRCFTPLAIIKSCHSLLLGPGTPQF